MIEQNLINDESIAFKQRETYISTINHDLKIPVIAQIRALELLADETLGSLNEKQKNMVSLVLESCHSIYNMLSAISYSYKFENHDIFMEYEYVSPIKLLNKILEDYNDSITKKKLKIKFTGNFLEIFADRLKISKAFEYILNYCIFSVSENSYIEIAENIDKNYINISFKFKSITEIKEKFKNNFNKYTVPCNKLDKVGSGLGLYLAKQIVEAHGGKIVVNQVGNIYGCSVYLINK